MLQIEKRAQHGSTAIDSLTLSYDERKKSRLRTFSDAGQEVAIVLPRGSSLRQGDLLLAESGEVLIVQAKREPVSEATTADPLRLTRAAYHLGNRHVPLQIGEGFVRYQPDHVLDAMVREQGLTVTEKQSAFQPEGGAYNASASHGSSSHAHGHSHDHDHAHAHDHTHDERDTEPDGGPTVTIYKPIEAPRRRR